MKKPTSLWDVTRIAVLAILLVGCDSPEFLNQTNPSSHFPQEFLNQFDSAKAVRFEVSRDLPEGDTQELECVPSRNEMKTIRKWFKSARPDPEPLKYEIEAALHVTNRNGATAEWFLLNIGPEELGLRIDINHYYRGLDRPTFEKLVRACGGAKGRKQAE